MVILVIQVNLVMSVNMAKLVNMHKSKLYNLWISIYVAIFVCKVCRTLQCKAYTQKALHKVRVVAYRNILLNLFKLSFLLGRTQSHMVLIFLMNKSESFF